MVATHVKARRAHASLLSRRKASLSLSPIRPEDPRHVNYRRRFFTPDQVAAMAHDIGAFE